MKIVGLKVLLAGAFIMSGCQGCDPDEDDNNENITQPDDSPPAMMLEDLPAEGREPLDEAPPEASLNNGLGEVKKASSFQVAQLALSDKNTYALEQDTGEMWFWGSKYLQSPKPIQIASPFHVARLHAGAEDSMCAQGSEGELKCYGVMGWEQAINQPDLTLLSPSEKRLCALSKADTVSCWGTQPQTLVREGIEQVVSTDRVVCVLAKGKVTCAGDNSLSELGIGADQKAQGEHTLELPGSATHLTRVSYDDAYLKPHEAFCALVDGAPWCWPRLGMKPTTTLDHVIAEPARVGVREDLVELSGGCALSAQGDVVCGYPVSAGAICVPKMERVLGQRNANGCGFEVGAQRWTCWAGTYSPAGDASIVADNLTWGCQGF